MLCLYRQSVEEISWTMERAHLKGKKQSKVLKKRSFNLNLVFFRKYQCWQVIKEFSLAVSTQNTEPQSRFLYVVICEIREFIWHCHHLSCKRCFAFSEMKALAKFCPVCLSSVLRYLWFWNIFCFVFWFQFVCISFWTLYTYNRELVYPKSLDGVIPLWLNHAMVSKKHLCLL